MDTKELGNRLSDRTNAIARNRGIAPMRFQSLVAREQLLAAVGRVAPEGTVALKGSALVLLDPEMSSYARPSTDLDLIVAVSGADELHDLLVRAAAETEAVGIRYEFGKTKALYKLDGTQGGEKTRVVAWIGRTRVNFELDAWFSGTCCPGMRVREAASLVPGLPVLRMLAYSPESAVAEKLHAIVQFGSANTRLKDFYDLWHLSQRRLDPTLLSECVAHVFAANGRAVPLVPTLLPGLGRSFAAANRATWADMLAAAERTGDAPADFLEVVTAVRAFANWAFAMAPAPKVTQQDDDVAQARRPRAFA